MTHITTRSSELFECAARILPMGVSSRDRAFKRVETPTIFVRKAKGSRVLDVDGNEYIDFLYGFGPLILGHSPCAVTRAIQEQAELGALFGTATEAEYRLARAIVDSSRCLEQVRFVCSGTEAVMTALRLAKAVTSRAKLVRFKGSYHGHADILMGCGKDRGASGIGPGIDDAIHDNTILCEYNDSEQLRHIFSRHRGEIAAVVVEPYACNIGLIKPAPGFLAAARDCCDADGALLIFDEVITAFRFTYGSVSGRMGVMPDLVTLGKIIGGGTPIGAYGGRKKYMAAVDAPGSAFPGGTFAGNPLSLVAGLAVLEELSRDGFYERLEALGRHLEDAIRDGFHRSGLPFGYVREGSVSSFILSPNGREPSNSAQAYVRDDSLFSRFHWRMAQRGFLLPPSLDEPMFLSSAHSEDELTSFASHAVETLVELWR